MSLFETTSAPAPVPIETGGVDSIDTMPGSDSFNPVAPLIRFVATAATSIAHGEAGPDAAGPNNTSLFCRELTRIEKPLAAATTDQVAKALTGLLSAYQFGEDSVPLLESLTGGELVASLFVAQFPLIYAGEGEGLFSGLDRYRYLTTRLATGVASTTSLATLWNFVARHLSLPMPGERYFPGLSALFTLPRSMQIAAMQAITKSTELVVMVARTVVKDAKLTNVGYALRTGLDFQEVKGFSPSVEQYEQLSQPGAEAIMARIPSLSGNALRHVALREPGARRLLSAVGLLPEHIPSGVEKFLFGGGNMAPKAKSPGNSDILETKVRTLYPFIDALSGCFDQFLMTRSMVSVYGWIVCAENNWFTSSMGVTSGISIYDMIEETTRTRQGIGGKLAEDGQMIFTYETLAKGTKVVFQFEFQPFTPRLTQGAVHQALIDWFESGGIFGARGASSHGKFTVNPRQCNEELAGEYLEYLAANQTQIRSGLLDGTFGTETILCAYK